MSRTLTLLLTLSAIPIVAQSFNCKLATTPREKTICVNTRLQALDAELAANYKSLRAQLSPESAALVQSDQNEWLHWLDLVCPAHGKGIADNQTQCLQDQYLARLNDLDESTAIGPGVIFSRAHFLYKPGETPDAAVNISPGFGYGSLRWPQIDKPNAAQSAFNAAIKTCAAKLAVRLTERPDHPVTFDTSVGASGIVDAYFIIEAANDRLIEITLFDGSFGWGAAHPNTQRTTFFWWLDRNRELTPVDVFLPSSGWQDHLVPLIIQRLQSQPELKPLLWQGEELTKSVQQEIADPANWSVTRDGLTITFGQYAVAAYAAGMPEVHFTWDELSPFLEPSLNPSTLPPPTPTRQS